MEQIVTDLIKLLRLRGDSMSCYAADLIEKGERLAAREEEAMKVAAAVLESASRAGYTTDFHPSPDHHFWHTVELARAFKDGAK